MLSSDSTILIVVDVQGKLAHLMYEKNRLFTNLQRIIKGAQILELPVLLTEQLPEKLGPTVAEISHLFSHNQPIHKSTFSCCGNDEFMQQLKALNRKQVLLAGIETHVCVYQTAKDLIESSYRVQIVTDAVSSRTAENRAIGLSRMRGAGAKLTSTEMALFELLKVAEGTRFKRIIEIIK